MKPAADADLLDTTDLTIDAGHSAGNCPMVNGEDKQPAATKIRHSRTIDVQDGLVRNLTRPLAQLFGIALSLAYIKICS